MARARLGAEGTVAFEQAPGGVEVRVRNVCIPNLTDGLHGFHVHARSVNAGDCASTGSHYDPHHSGHHGGRGGLVRHLGDMGNLRAHGGCLVDTTFFAPGLTVAELQGRSVVLHEHEDDLGAGGTEASRASGNSGARIACGTIL